MTATVGVVIPCYNVAALVHRAIESVLAQTWPAIQLVLVDDGSTDDTLSVLNRYRDRAVILATKPNRGPSAARNTGLEAVGKADCVAFLDADDSFDPEKVSRQVAALDRDRHLGAVGCRMRYVGPAGKMLGTTGEDLGPVELERVRHGGLVPFVISSVLFRAEALHEIGGFDPALRLGEDLDIMARLARRWPMASLPETLGEYQIQPHSAAASNGWALAEACRFLRWRWRGEEEDRSLGFEEFLNRYPPSLRQHWEVRTANLYRLAGLRLAEGRRLSALVYGGAALATRPLRTARRALHQKVVPTLFGGQLQRLDRATRPGPVK